MKKTLLFIFLFSFGFANSQEIIYQTTVVGTSGAEIAPTANGAACSMGDAIVMAGTNRALTSISGRFFNLVALTPYTMTMSVFTQCPTSSATAACGTLGTIIPGATSTVTVTPTGTVGTVYTVTFPFSNIDLSAETDNTITVMVTVSRNDVYWVLGETPTIGAMPAGETGLGFATRCGSTAANNGCARNFGIANNFSMTVSAASLSVDAFAEKSFSVFPNPVNDKITISNTSNSTINTVKITDLNGRIIMNINSNSIADVEINVSDLSAGIYLMNIDSDKGVFTKKIIKE